MAMTFFSDQSQIIWDFVIFSISSQKSFSEIDSYSTMFFFDYKKLLKSWKKFIKNMPIYEPFMTNFPIYVLSLSRILKSSVSFKEVINKTFRCRRNRHSKCVVSTRNRYVEASFSINNSCKISQFYVSPFHKSPFFVVNLDKESYHTLTTKYRYCGERLNEKTSFEDAKV